MQASFSFSLDSGSRAVLVGRVCAFDGTVRWHSRLEPRTGAGGQADATTLDTLTQQAMHRYGGTTQPLPDEATVLDVCRRRLPIDYDGREELDTH